VSSDKSSSINFRLHPRVFAALGLDLVTNDAVAVIELVKNSYDALATRVDVRFVGLEGELPIALEVQDNGTGMTLDELSNVWAVVATPYKLLHPIASKGRKRRVSGEKGLGRLSTARLGTKLELTTKAHNSPCLHVDLDWKVLSNEKSITDCKFAVTTLEECPFQGSGTLIKITELGSEWGNAQFDDLSDQLSRLVSPFQHVKDFSIWLTLPGRKAKPAQIESAAFLSSPPYSLKGAVNSRGELRAEYTFTGVKTKETKIAHSLQPPSKVKKKTACGPFAFEIRAWDFDTDNLGRLSLEIDMGKEKIRKAIRNYKGLSVYRDQILVLPKSDAGRDWLGLDLRRISKLGTRLSTSQIVGYVAVSSRRNPDLTDTSDRERLADNPASREFKYLLKRVVEALEDQRDRDRGEAVHREPPLKNLFESLTASHLARDIRQLVAANAPAAEIVPLVEDFQAELQTAVEEIERRFYYYSRVASLGLLAATIVHEVRNKSVVLGRLISMIRKHFSEDLSAHENLQRATDLADQALKSLEGLAETFGPLAARSASKRRVSDLRKITDECIAMRGPEIESTKTVIEVHVKDDIVVRVDPGELSAVLINFLDNSLYWLSYVPENKRRMLFEAKRHGERVDVNVHDSGVGVTEGDEERIFWPGVTKKPGGLGMGLTVASEIVSQHGGKTKLVVPGSLGGASFAFDLPLSK
jgi:signal transduction histidine kinase